jgi:hypothetical protein
MMDATWGLTWSFGVTMAILLVLHYFPITIMKIAESDALNNDDELKQDEDVTAAWQYNISSQADTVRLQPLERMGQTARQDSV